MSPTDEARERQPHQHSDRLTGGGARERRAFKNVMSSDKKDRELKLVLGFITVPPNARATTVFGDRLERASPDGASYQRRFPWRKDAGITKRGSMLLSGGERRRRKRGTRRNLPLSPTTEPAPRRRLRRRRASW